MKKILVAALAFAALPAVALGQPDYDRNIEQAAMAIVAAKMGELRGGFAVDQKPAFTIITEAAAHSGEWREGLAVATDQRIVPAHSF